MVEILDEIKEDLQQEHYAEMWKKYGNVVIGLVVAVVVITAGYVWWSGYAVAKRSEYGDALFFAMKKETKKAKLPEVMDAYSKLLGGASVEHAAVAGLRKSVLLLQDGRIADAQLRYQVLFEDDNNPLEIRELAKLLYLYKVIEDGGDDIADDVDMLRDMAVVDGPFRYSAKELLAFYNYQKDDLQVAGRLFGELRDGSAVPVNIARRAEEMMNAIGVREAK